MSRYAVDAAVAIRLADAGTAPPGEHRLVAASRLRTQVLAALYRDVRTGERTEGEALEMLARIVSMRIRLLSDRVSMRTAWRIARDLGWPEIGDAEHLAVAVLQADAMVTEDPVLIEAAEGLVAVAPASVLGL